MIVIATHNGHDRLNDLLNDLKEHKCNIPISIIDTQSENKISLQFLESVSQIYTQLNIRTFKTPNKNFEAGSFMFAIENIPAERYYFLQDSIRIKDCNAFLEIDKLLKPGNVVSIATFKGNYFCNEHLQKPFCELNWKNINFDKGIFGNMFCILASDLEKSKLNLPKILPATKQESMAMERGWGIFCKQSNLNIISLEGDWTVFNHNTGKYFGKVFSRDKPRLIT